MEKVELNEVQYLGDKDIMKLAKGRRNITQVKLAEMLGMNQGGLSANMRRDRVSVGMFLRILNTLNYEVVVVDRETGKVEWKVETDND